MYHRVGALNSPTQIFVSFPTKTSLAFPFPHTTLSLESPISQGFVLSSPPSSSYLFGRSSLASLQYQLPGSTAASIGDFPEYTVIFSFKFLLEIGALLFSDPILLKYWGFLPQVPIFVIRVWFVLDGR